MRQMNPHGSTFWGAIRGTYIINEEEEAPKKAVKFIPTMGLTIRKHQTAIGHRARNKLANKRVGARHPNGSRAYR